MKILFDECVPKRLRKLVTGHEVRTVQEAGWAGVKNGSLLALAEKQFEVFVTVDRNLSFQQHLPKYKIAVLVLSASSNQLSDLKPLIPRMLKALRNIESQRVIIIS